MNFREFELEILPKLSDLNKEPYLFGDIQTGMDREVDKVLRGACLDCSPGLLRGPRHDVRQTPTRLVTQLVILNIANRDECILR